MTELLFSLLMQMDSTVFGLSVHAQSQGGFMFHVDTHKCFSWRILIRFFLVFYEEDFSFNFNFSSLLLVSLLSQAGARCPRQMHQSL